MLRYIRGGPMSRHPRYRRCRECHDPATHVELEQRPAAVLHRDGSIDRFVETVSVFWCDVHTGMELTR